MLDNHFLFLNWGREVKFWGYKFQSKKFTFKDMSVKVLMTKTIFNLKNPPKQQHWVVHDWIKKKIMSEKKKKSLIYLWFCEVEADLCLLASSWRPRRIWKGRGPSAAYRVENLHPFLFLSSPVGCQTLAQPHQTPADCSPPRPPHSESHNHWNGKGDEGEVRRCVYMLRRFLHTYSIYWKR